MIKFFLLLVVVILIACGNSVVTQGGATNAVTKTDFLYRVDISNLKAVPRNAHGAHHGGVMDTVDFDGDDISNAAVGISDEIKLNYARFPGGGHLKFMHLMYDENGNPSKGYGYRRQEITDYINGGGGTSRDLDEWMAECDHQDALNYRYIDRYVEYYNSLQSPPDIIFGMNVTLGGVQENLDALKYLIDNGVNVVAVEMGNEAYSQFNSWASYFAKAKPFLESVKSNYPSIERSVVVAPFSGRNTHVNWNNGLKTDMAASDLIQAGVYHFYPNMDNACTDMFTAYYTPKQNFEIQYDSKDPIVGPISDCFNSGFKKFTDTDANDLKTNLDTNFPGFHIYMTEWNFTPIDGATNTMAEAFFDFKMIRKIQENPNIIAATAHNFIAPAGHGMVTPGGDNDSIDMPLHKRAKYYSFLVHSYAQEGYQEGTHNITFPGVTAYSYFKEGKILLIGINESESEYAIDNVILGVDGYNTRSCSITAAKAKQLYSSAGGNDFIGKNNFYKTHVAPYEIDGMKIESYIPALSIFSVSCDIEKILPPPPPPPPPAKPWYCKVLPWLKECKK